MLLIKVYPSGEQGATEVHGIINEDVEIILDYINDIKN